MPTCRAYNYPTCMCGILARGRSISYAWFLVITNLKLVQPLPPQGHERLEENIVQWDRRWDMLSNVDFGKSTCSDDTFVFPLGVMAV